MGSLWQFQEISSHFIWLQKWPNHSKLGIFYDIICWPHLTFTEPELTEPQDIQIGQRSAVWVQDALLLPDVGHTAITRDMIKVWSQGTASTQRAADFLSQLPMYSRSFAMNSVCLLQDMM